MMQKRKNLNSNSGTLRARKARFSNRSGGVSGNRTPAPGSIAVALWPCPWCGDYSSSGAASSSAFKASRAMRRLMDSLAR